VVESGSDVVPLGISVVLSGVAVVLPGVSVVPSGFVVTAPSPSPPQDTRSMDSASNKAKSLTSFIQIFSFPNYKALIPANSLYHIFRHMSTCRHLHFFEEKREIFAVFMTSEKTFAKMHNFY
jgi:hypothetical protein